jgi:HK97 family phage major capsid protein
MNILRRAVQRALFGFERSAGGKGRVLVPNGKSHLAADHFSRPMDRKDTDPAAIKSLEDLKSAFLANHKEIKGLVDAANQQVKDSGKIALETKAAIDNAVERINTLGVRIDKIEAKGNADRDPPPEVKSLGQQFLESEDYKGSLGSNQTGSPMALAKSKRARLELKGFDVKAIVNATGQNQPLVPDQRLPGIQTLPNRRLRIRQLIPTGQTTSNLIQYVKENVFTNNAGPQVGGSPTVAAENATKNESDITFTLANAPVITLAHFILASRQVLDDAPMLASYINGRLLYGLALEEEDELLNGDGTVGQLDGLIHQATAFNRAQTGTKLDWLRRAITQLQLSEYDAEFIVLNPADWEDIELTKDTQGRYIIANPQSMLGPQIWGLPVIPTNSMTVSNFLVANATQAAQIWDRQQAAVELSREDGDNFKKNMVTILAEERLALTVYRPTALIKGVFTV